MGSLEKIQVEAPPQQAFRRQSGPSFVQLPKFLILLGILWLFTIFKSYPIDCNDSVQNVKRELNNPVAWQDEDSRPTYDKIKEEKTSDWPQPTQNLEAPPEELKLVRIGKGGPVDDARGFLHENLEEFLEIYKDRPDKSNTCGIRISHSLAIYTIAKRLQPNTIVESGVNSGQSTYFFRKAAPSAKIISIDPESKPICGQPVRWIDDTNNEYLTGNNFVDFDKMNWG